MVSRDASRVGATRGNRVRGDAGHERSPRAADRASPEARRGRRDRARRRASTGAPRRRASPSPRPPASASSASASARNAVDQRGGEVENYVSDGPYQRGASAGRSPRSSRRRACRARDDATYFPIPWLLSTRGYGVLVDNDETSVLPPRQRRRATPGRVEVAGARSLRAARLRRARAGRRRCGASPRASAASRRAAAPFYFGPWFQPTRRRRGRPRRRCAGGRRAGSVAQTYTHYLPCGDQAAASEAERARTSASTTPAWPSRRTSTR